MTENTKTVLGLGGVILLVGIFLSFSENPNKEEATIAAPLITDPALLPGAQLGQELPWKLESAQLKERLKAIGLPALAMEGNALHIHQHLDIIINGTKTPVPATIGISATNDFIAPLHIHDDSGVVHVESPVVKDFTLGQVFDVWGVRFTKDCIGGYCTTASSTLQVFVNGKEHIGDPRTLVLASHQEIAVIFGTKENFPQTIPAEYTFPAGE